MLGYIYAVVMAISWSIAAILYRFAVKDKDVLVVTLLRVYPAFFVTFLGTLFLEHIDVEALMDPYLILMAILTGALAMLVGSYAYIYAIKNAGVSITYPVAFSYPLYVSLIAVPLLGELLTIGLVIGLILQLIGLVILAFDSSSEEISHVRKGVLAAVIASLSWTFNSILVKIVLYVAQPVMFAFMRLLALSIIITPLCFIKYNKIRAFTVKEILAAIIGGMIGIGFAIILYHLAIIEIGAARTALISSSSPALSILLALVILHERPSTRALLGAILVTAAVIFVIVL